MQIALVHDWLTGWRGGERVLHEIALLYPDADLFTLIHVPGTTSRLIDDRRIQTSPLSKLPWVSHYYRLLLPLFPWAIRRFDLSSYDLVISCSHAVAKSVRIGPATAHLCYCLTPMRYIWDHVDAYLGSRTKRRLAWPLLRYLRRFDRKYSTPDSVTRFVAISSEVRLRIARHYQRDSSVVFPPVDVETVWPTADAPIDDREDFYLLVGGFVPYKFESLAIEAFRQMDRKLVIAGDGPTRRRLERTAPDNVEFLGHISDERLHALYAGCRALLYPQEEDFGMVAVEAQAAGRPVIAYGRGGCLDTVRPLLAPESSDDPDGFASGIFFQRQTPEALIAAIQEFEMQAERFDSKRIQTWAERFGSDRFRAAFRREVQNMLELQISTRSS